ncbi:hypothetical protein [Rhizobium sp.]
MEIGSSVIWRESVITMKDGRRIKTGERNVTGTIMEHSRLRTGGKTVKIAVTAVQGNGQDIVGQQVWRKRTNLAKGRSWYRAMTKPSKPEWH